MFQWSHSMEVELLTNNDVGDAGWEFHGGVQHPAPWEQLQKDLPFVHMGVVSRLLLQGTAAVGAIKAFWQHKHNETIDRLKTKDAVVILSK